MTAPTRTGRVWCHRCPAAEDYANRAEAGMHDAATSTLIGSPYFGALWHCPTHADCPTCPRGSWTDADAPRRHGWPRTVAP